MEEVKQTSDSRHRVGFMYCKDKNVNACAFFPEKRLCEGDVKETPAAIGVSSLGVFRRGGLVGF